MAESNSQETRCPCGFFGSAQTLGLCSKCFKIREMNRDHQMTADLISNRISSQHNFFLSQNMAHTTNNINNNINQNSLLNNNNNKNAFRNNINNNININGNNCSEKNDFRMDSHFTSNSFKINHNASLDNNFTTNQDSVKNISSNQNSLEEISSNQIPFNNVILNSQRLLIGEVLLNHNSINNNPIDINPTNQNNPTNKLIDSIHNATNHNSSSYNRSSNQSSINSRSSNQETSSNSNDSANQSLSIITTLASNIVTASNSSSLDQDEIGGKVLNKVSMNNSKGSFPSDANRIFLNQDESVHNVLFFPTQDPLGLEYSQSISTLTPCTSSGSLLLETASDLYSRIQKLAAPSSCSSSDSTYQPPHSSNNDSCCGNNGNDFSCHGNMQNIDGYELKDSKIFKDGRRAIDDSNGGCLDNRLIDDSLIIDDRGSREIRIINDYSSQDDGIISDIPKISSIPTLISTHTQLELTTMDNNFICENNVDSLPYRGLVFDPSTSSCKIEIKEVVGVKEKKDEGNFASAASMVSDLNLNNMAKKNIFGEVGGVGKEENKLDFDASAEKFNRDAIHNKLNSIASAETSNKEMIHNVSPDPTSRTVSKEKFKFIAIQGIIDALTTDNKAMQPANPSYSSNRSNLYSPNNDDNNNKDLPYLIELGKTQQLQQQQLAINLPEVGGNETTSLQLSMSNNNNIASNGKTVTSNEDEEIVLFNTDKESDWSRSRINKNDSAAVVKSEEKFNKFLKTLNDPLLPKSIKIQRIKLENVKKWLSKSQEAVKEIMYWGDEDSRCRYEIDESDSFAGNKSVLKFNNDDHIYAAVDSSADSSQPKNCSKDKTISMDTVNFMQPGCSKDKIIVTMDTVDFKQPGCSKDKIIVSMDTVKLKQPGCSKDKIIISMDTVDFKQPSCSKDEIITVNTTNYSLPSRSEYITNSIDTINSVNKKTTINSEEGNFSIDTNNSKETETTKTTDPEDKKTAGKKMDGLIVGITVVDKATSNSNKELKRKHEDGKMSDELPEKIQILNSRVVVTMSDQKNRKRCYKCNCRLDLANQTIGRCKCNFVFCQLHRLPEQHDCLFDHKGTSRQGDREKMVIFRKQIGTSLKRLDSDP